MEHNFIANLTEIHITWNVCNCLVVLVKIVPPSLSPIVLFHYIYFFSSNTFQRKKKTTIFPQIFLKKKINKISKIFIFIKAHRREVLYLSNWYIQFFISISIYSLGYISLIEEIIIYY